MRKVFLPCYQCEYIETYKRYLNVKEHEIVPYTMLNELSELIDSSSKGSNLLLISILAENTITTDIYKKLTKIDIPTLIITPPEHYSAIVKSIKYHPLIEIFNSCYGPNELNHTLARLISIIERSPAAGMEMDEFTTVNKAQILKFTHYPTDIYLRLSHSKIVKIFNREDEVDRELVHKYAASKEALLLVKTLDHKSFIENIRNQLKLSSKKIKSLDFNQKLQLSVSECHLVAQVLPLFTVDENFMGVMNDLLNHVFDVVRDSSSLTQILGKKGPLTNKEKKLSTALVSTILAKKHMKADHNELGKLIIASFFCDISLDQNGVKPLDLEEASSFTYLKQAKLKYLNHPNESVDFVSRFINMNLDASAIIREHHELPDGSGYPKQLREMDLHPLSRIFITASYVVDFISDKSDQLPTPEEVIIAARRKFDPHFSDILISLKAAMLPQAENITATKKAS